jgi:hypothetical protein
VATRLVRALPKRLRERMQRAMRQLGYAKGVVTDEINAYLATSSEGYLFKRFKLKGTDLLPTVKFKAAFREYQPRL